MSIHRLFALSLILSLNLTACGSEDADSSETADEASTSSSDSTTGETTSTDGATNGGTDTTDPAGTDSHTILMVTSLGDIRIELDPTHAPRTTENFLAYVDAGFYDGADGNGKTTFHRVISGFMVQGGGMKVDGSQKPTRSPIDIESDNGLSNRRGTIAMARTNDPNSATSQFYINHTDNAFLDYESSANPGYTVFGQVIEGLETVDAIAAVATDAGDKPLETVTIESVIRSAD